MSEIEKLNFSVEAISGFLKGENLEAKEMILDYLLLISAKDSDQLIKETLITDLITVASQNDSKLGKLALDSLINLTATENGSDFISKSDKNVSNLLKIALNPQSNLSDQSCIILSNMTRSRLEKTETFIASLESIVDAISNKSYNKKGLKLTYLSQLFGNLTQSLPFQKAIIETGLIKKVFPVLNVSSSRIEKLGVASSIYNCLFDIKSHMKLLEFEVLPVLLLPLAGPETFEDDEYEKMPLDLQYLPDDKERESDPDVKNLLLRSLLLLCSSKEARIFIREHNSYLILREYHKYEEDRKNLLAAENVIDILIRTEDEIGIDDLSSLQVPDDLIEKFEKWDNDYINN